MQSVGQLLVQGGFLLCPKKGSRFQRLAMGAKEQSCALAIHRCQLDPGPIGLQHGSATAIGSIEENHLKLLRAQSNPLRSSRRTVTDPKSHINQDDVQSQKTNDRLSAGDG